MKKSIKLLKVVFILLMVQIAWVAFNLEKLVETMNFVNSSIIYLLAVINVIIILIVIGLIKNENTKNESMNSKR